MNFRVYFFVVIFAIPVVSHGRCLNDWDSSIKWDRPFFPTIPGKYSNGDILTDGDKTSFNFYLPRDVSYSPLTQLAHNHFPHVDELRLTYSYKTVDGTAKAGIDYVAKTGEVSWSIAPRNRSHGNSKAQLYFKKDERTDPCIDVRTIERDRSRPHWLTEGTGDNKRSVNRYFFVVLYTPRLYMEAHWDRKVRKSGIEGMHHWNVSEWAELRCKHWQCNLKAKRYYTINNRKTLKYNIDEVKNEYPAAWFENYNNNNYPLDEIKFVVIVK